MAVVKVKPWGKGQGDYVLIEADDMIEGVHELWEPDPERAPEPDPEPLPRTRKLVTHGDHR